MKRSEAIEAIGKVLTYGGDGFPADKKHAYEKKSLADIILTELESLGMTPPINDWALYTDGDKADSSDVRYHTWETEDEEK